LILIDFDPSRISVSVFCLKYLISHCERSGAFFFLSVIVLLTYPLSLLASPFVSRRSRRQFVELFVCYMYSTYRYGNTDGVEHRKVQQEVEGSPSEE